MAEHHINVKAKMEPTSSGNLRYAAKWWYVDCSCGFSCVGRYKNSAVGAATRHLEESQPTTP